MNKRELLNKKMDILNKVITNIDNSPQIFGETLRQNPEILDKSLKQSKKEVDKKKLKNKVLE